MIKLKTSDEIVIMAEGGKLLAQIMEKIANEIKPGVTTRRLDVIAEKLILKAGGKCSFKGYNAPDDSSPDRVYPNCLCTSVNEEIVHSIPSVRILKEGDIVSIDIGMEYKGFHNDMARTFPVGAINEQAQKLLGVTKEALKIGINCVKPGNKIGDIGRAVQKYVESEGFGVVRELCGHGIGREVHEDPEILNFVSFDRASVDKAQYSKDAKTELKEGMVICIEPMVTVGDWHIKGAKDGFGFESKDGSLSCHFEDTIAVTKDGYDILTKI